MAFLKWVQNFFEPKNSDEFNFNDFENSVNSVELWKSEDTLKAWVDFFSPEIFMQWASELKTAIALKDKSAWDLTGTGVMLVSDTQDQALSVMSRVAADAGMTLFRVPSHAVEAQVPELRQKFIEFAPAIVFLEAGDWVVSNQDPHAFSPFGGGGTAFSKALREDMTSFDEKNPVVIVTAVGAERMVCDDLKKVGAFDRVFVFDQPTPEFLAAQFIEKVGNSLFEDQALVARKKMGLLLQAEFDDVDQQNMLALRVQRLARTESRKINFNDLANFALRGVSEHNRVQHSLVDGASRRKTALHEAGHACIAIIASGGENVPDYATVVPSKNFEGVVFESLSYYDKMEDFTYNNMLLKTRVFLAGRAAEELFYGSADVSSGANSDLAAVNRMCFSLFAYSGFHPEMSSSLKSSANLAVLNSRDVDPVQYDRISKEVRAFLQSQYQYVMETLEQNRSFVEAVADRLLWDPVVDQSELMDLSNRFGVHTHAVE